MALKFDKNAFLKEFLNILEDELAVAFNAWETEALSKMRNIKFYKGSKARVSNEIERQSNIIIGYLKANPVALADSYGTGSLMVLSNPGFEEYRKSDRWNPARTGKRIVGRPMGVYKDMFGRTHVTSGTFKGKPIENRSFGKKYHIIPTPPSYAIQMANQWLYKTYLPRAYKNAAQKINFTKFLIES